MGEESSYWSRSGGQLSLPLFLQTRHGQGDECKHLASKGELVVRVGPHMAYFEVADWVASSKDQATYPNSFSPWSESASMCICREVSGCFSLFLLYVQSSHAVDWTPGVDGVQRIYCHRSTHRNHRCLQKKMFLSKLLRPLECFSLMSRSAVLKEYCT